MKFDIYPISVFLLQFFLSFIFDFLEFGVVTFLLSSPGGSIIFLFWFDITTTKYSDTLHHFYCRNYSCLAMALLE